MYKQQKEVLEEKIDNITNKYNIIYSDSLPKVLHENNVCIAISTYQAGKLIFIGSKNNKDLFQVPISFKKPMGITFVENKIAVATLNTIEIFSNSKALSKTYPNNPDTYDSLFMPRATYYSGETDVHDINFGDNLLWGVNTKFSCLSTYDINFSFTPRWKPPFITELLPQDRCHLNGMAMQNGKPAFVTALSKTNYKDGWREDITNSGILMEVPSGKIILENLPMPHSPRIINNELYLLFSATGEIAKVDLKTSKVKIIYKFKGFIRGLAHINDILIIGVSKIRKTSKTFSKLPVNEFSENAGFFIYDLNKDEIVAELKYLNTVEEIYDVQAIHDIGYPGMITSDNEIHYNSITTNNISMWKKNIETNN